MNNATEGKNILRTNSSFRFGYHPAEDEYFCLQEPDKKISLLTGIAHEESTSLSRRIHSFPVFPAKQLHDGNVTVARKIIIQRAALIAREYFEDHPYEPTFAQQNISNFSGIKKIDDIYAPDAKIQDFFKLQQFLQRSKQGYDKIKSIRISDTTLSSEELKTLPGDLSRFPKVQQLILVNIGLQTLDNIVLPNLKTLNVSSNDITDIETIISFLTRSTKLRELKIFHNPVIFFPAFNSEVTKFPNIKELNGKSTANRRASIVTPGKYGNWEKALLALPAIQPFLEAGSLQKVTKIHLDHLELEFFRVNWFPNLQELNLSHNNIKSISHCGMELCSQLRIIDFSYNSLYNSAELAIFYFLDHLQELSLQGNNELGDYNDIVLYITRFSGSLSSGKLCGLETLDHTLVSASQRLEACQEMTQENYNKLNRFKWWFHYRTFLGTEATGISNFTSQLTQLVLRGCDLCVLFPLNVFANLEYLDVSGNPLKTILGCESLKRLKYLNASGCLYLNLDDTLDRLSQLWTLEEVILCITGPYHTFDKHNRSSTNRNYRASVLAAICPPNSKLWSLDDCEIHLNERANAYKAYYRLNPSLQYSPSCYKFLLYLIDDIKGLGPGKSFASAEIQPGIMYQPSDVLSLSLAANGISNKMFNSQLHFGSFVNLTQLDLSLNKISDLQDLNLQPCVSLVALDLHRNIISNSLEEVAELLDSLPKLEFVALRGNPSLSIETHRIEFLSMLSCLENVHCKLKVIDTPISMQDRFDALALRKKSNLEDSETNRLRIGIYQNSFPSGNAVVKEIDLSGIGIQMLHAEQFPSSLEVLLLRNNMFSSFDDIVGLDSLKKLRVLDIRDCNVASWSSSFEYCILNELPSLEAIGLSGNKFCQVSDYREKIISSLDVSSSRLRSIDEIEITPDEFPGTKDHNIKLRTCIMRAKAFHGDVEITKLEIIDCALSVIDLSQLPNLTYLSLADNLLNCQSLTDSNLDKLMHLVHLDVTGNKFENLTSLANLTNNLARKSLKEINMHRNPCFQSRDDISCRNEFLLMLKCVMSTTKTIKLLNEEEVTYMERIKVVQELMEGERLERKINKLLFQAEQIPDPHSVTVLALPRVDVKSLYGFEQFTHITALDLSHNSITTLNASCKVKKAKLKSRGDCVLFSLTKLQYLDLRYNILDSLDESIELLAQMSQLNNLSIMDSTQCSADTRNPLAYANGVFERIRSLRYLDGMLTPYPCTLQSNQCCFAFSPFFSYNQIDS